MLTSCGGELGTERGTLANIHSIEATQVRGQFIVTIIGSFPDSCSTLGQPRQEVKRQTITVTVYTQRQRGASCEPVAKPFTERILLDVEGLSAGQYTVSVNGTVTTINVFRDQ
jgi:inhibitor of cysteine peptidase